MPKYQIWVLKHIVPYIGLIVALFVASKQLKVRHEELKNKIYIMELVNDADRILELSNDGSLDQAIKLAYQQDKFESLWLAEGASFRWHLSNIEQTGGNLPKIPDNLVLESLPMVHAGLGLAVCRYYLECYKKGQFDLSTALANISKTIDEVADRKFAAYAYESLGLVTTILHGPNLVRKVDTELKAKNKSHRNLFWHGCGRATYFYPTNFIPTKHTLTRSFRMLDGIAYDELSKRNMAGGIFTAFILVNMKSPSVYHSLLRNSDLVQRWDYELKNRMEVAPMVRLSASGSVDLVNTLIKYSPDAMTAWEEYIATPLAQSLENHSNNMELSRLFAVPQHNNSNKGAQ